MKIIVMSCSPKDAWWRNLIGKVLPVKEEDQREYSVMVNKNKIEKILKSNCEIIER
jgi:hypothetical protein